MRDHAYDRIPYRAPQMEHRYGPNVHIIADPLALTQLARLCAKGTYQPEINTLVAVLYRDLLRVIVNSEFPRRTLSFTARPWIRKSAPSPSTSRAPAPSLRRSPTTSSTRCSIRAWCGRT